MSDASASPLTAGIKALRDIALPLVVIMSAAHSCTTGTSAAYAGTGATGASPLARRAYCNRSRWFQLVSFLGAGGQCV
jgi:hypothetical protein